MPILQDGVLLHAISGSSCPACEPRSDRSEYSQPYRHIAQPHSEPLGHSHLGNVSIAGALARCRYRRLQSASQRAALALLPPCKKRNRELPCLVLWPGR